MLEFTPREALESVILIQTSVGMVGSGVVFRHRGDTLVATAAHVLGEGTRTPAVSVYEQGRFADRLGAVLHKTGAGRDESDIAVLQLWPEPSGGDGWAMGIGNTGVSGATAGKPAQVLGFPGGRWASERREEGRLVPNALVQAGVVGGTQTNGRPRKIYIAAQLFPGFSGGAIITEGAGGKANLIGIVSRTMDLDSPGWTGQYAGFAEATAFDDVLELLEGDPAGVDLLRGAQWAEDPEEDESGTHEEDDVRSSGDDRSGTLGEHRGARRTTMRNARHVVPHREGWAVLKPDARRASSVHSTQSEAISRARDILENDGGGELITHGRDGRMRDGDTVHPGGDPRRRKG